MNKVKRLYDIFRHQGFDGLYYRLESYTVPRGPQLGYLHPTEGTLKSIRNKQEGFTFLPKISLLMPVFNPPVRYLEQAIESVRDQIYSDWELCIADDASTDPTIRDLLQGYEEDDRIRIVYREDNGHISAASNSALELATGDYIALFDHDDLLAPHALTTIVAELQQDNLVDILYTDEAKINDQGHITEPTRKPEWSPHYLRSYMYPGHLTVYRREVLQKVEGFRSEFDGSQDYDLMLRVAEHATNVTRIPEVVYYWRVLEGSVAQDRFAKPYAYEAAQRALTSSLQEREPHYRETETTLYPGVVRHRYHLPQDRSVKIVPLRKEGAPELTPVTEAYVFFLGNDETPLTEDWSDSMIEHLQAEDVGAVTPLRIGTDKRVRTAGYSLIDDELQPRFAGALRYDVGEGMQLVCGMEVDGAPFSCCMVHGKLWNSFVTSCEQEGEASDPLEKRFSLFLKKKEKVIYYTPFVTFCGQ